MFKLEFDTENAAFEDAGFYEVMRILEDVKKRIGEGVEAGTVRDANGNSVGRFDLSD